MAKANGHWLLMGNQIVVELNDGSYSSIAAVENERAVRQMLRYTQLAQDIETIADQWGAGKLRPTEVADMCLALVANAIVDISPRDAGVKIPCPEIEQEGVGDE